MYTVSTSQNNSSMSGPELNLETGSIVESKQLVDEILLFNTGRSIPIKDLFRLGKLARPSSGSSCFLIRETTSSSYKVNDAWDRRVVLYSKRKLKDFRLGHLFLQEDLSPEHKDRRQKVGPASGNRSSSTGSKPASVPRGSSGSLVRTLSPVVPTSEKSVCREGIGPSSSHASVPTTVSLLTAPSDNTSPTDASALCAAAPSVPLQDKTIV